MALYPFLSLFAQCRHLLLITCDTDSVQFLELPSVLVNHNNACSS